MGQLALITTFVLAGVLLWGASLVAKRRREAVAADSFAAVAGMMGFGALALATGVAMDLPRTILTASVLIISLFVPVPWSFFSLAYNGRDELVTPGSAAVVTALPVVGALATMLIFGSQLFPWLTLPSRQAASGLAAVSVALLSMFQWIALLYAGGLVLTGSGILLWTFQRYEYLDSTTGMLLGIFGTIPWLSLLFGFQVANINFAALPRTIAVAFLVGGIAAVTVLGRYQVFRNAPAAGNVGPATVVEDLEDLLIVTGDEGMIVQINPAVERALDTSAADEVGADVDRLLEISVPNLRETEIIELQTTVGRELFEPTVSELTDRHGHCFGYAIGLRDVTARTNRQQRLEVLNRVLRHNLNNDMTVIIGQAQHLRDNIDDSDLVERLETILGTARNLTRLSKEARGIEKQMATAESVSEDIRLASLIKEVRETVDSDSQNVAYENNVPMDLVIEGTKNLVELALTHLVENAIEHNDSEEPYVKVQADFDAERTYPLIVSVVDNGPGIPDEEKRVIEKGGETSLEHGSGLGLWTVRWAVTRLGGEISFGRDEPRKTVVSLSFPQAHRTDPGLEKTTSEARE